jgi:hypothetical protein
MRRPHRWRHVPAARTRSLRGRRRDDGSVDNGDVDDGSLDDGNVDDGSVSVELVVATPLMLLLFMTVVQFALWAHAAHVARAAASSGVQTARACASSADAGRDETTTVLGQLAGSVLTDTHVEARRDPTTATVTVTGTAITVVPGLHLPVRASVTAPRELIPGTP